MSQENILKELLEALKDHPESIEVEIGKIGGTLEDCDINEMMKDVDLPKILNPIGMMIMHTMSTAVCEGGKMTDLQERKGSEFVADVMKLVMKYQFNYAESLLAIGNAFSHMLENNPQSSPKHFRRKANED